jgi:hypothetical protein
VELECSGLLTIGAGGSVMVEALRYKQEGRGFETDDVNEFFQFT